VVVHDFEPAVARHREVDCNSDLGLVGHIVAGV
jgi:hypothetical protein